MIVNSFDLRLTNKLENGQHWHNDPKYAERKDHYFAGTITINDKPVPAELHLMTCDGSIRGQRGKWSVSIDLNKQEYFDANNKAVAENCHLCCKHDNSRKASNSETAMAWPMSSSRGWKNKATHWPRNGKLIIPAAGTRSTAVAR